MIRLILDPDTSAGAHGTALSLLVFVAGHRSIEAVVNQAKADWGGARTRGYIKFFAEVGYAGLFETLEAGLDEEQRRAYSRELETLKRELQLAGNPSALLDCLRSGDCETSYRWLFRRALREGVAHENVRAALVSAAVAEGVGLAAMRPSLAEALLSARSIGLLDTEDLSGASGLGEALEHLSVCDDWDSPAWASDTIAEVRREFYNSADTRAGE